MPEIEKKLNEMGYQLTEPRRSAVGNFVPAVRTGNLVYTAGTGPGLPDGGLLHVGKLGADKPDAVGLEGGQEPPLGTKGHQFSQTLHAIHNLRVQVAEVGPQRVALPGGAAPQNEWHARHQKSER